MDIVDIELIKQKIISNIEQRKTFWTIELVIGGGVAAILTNMDSFIKFILFLIGVFLLWFFAIAIKDVNEDLRNLFKKMEQK